MRYSMEKAMLGTRRQSLRFPFAKLAHLVYEGPFSESFTYAACGEMEGHSWLINLRKNN